MKSTRRHELKTNDLADHLGRILEQIKPYSKAISGVLLAACVVIVVSMLLSQRNRRLEAAAWDQYTLAMGSASGSVDMDELLDVAESYSGTTAAQWASLAWADKQLQQGAAELFRDRDVGESHLRKAIQQYLVLAQGAKAPDLIRDRALFGLARSYEALGDLDNARQNYESVRGELSQIAQDRAKLLDNQAIKEFYDWFATADVQTPITGPGEPGVRPSIFDGMTFDDEMFLPQDSSGASGSSPLNLQNSDLEAALGGLPASAETPAGPLFAPPDAGPAPAPPSGLLPEANSTPQPDVAPDSDAAPETDATPSGDAAEPVN